MLGFAQKSEAPKRPPLCQGHLKNWDRDTLFFDGTIWKPFRPFPSEYYFCLDHVFIGFRIQDGEGPLLGDPLHFTPSQPKQGTLNKTAPPFLPVGSSQDGAKEIALGFLYFPFPGAEWTPPAPQKLLRARF